MSELHSKWQRRSVRVENLGIKSSCMQNNNSKESKKILNFKTSSQRKIKCLVSEKSLVKKTKQKVVSPNYKKTPPAFVRNTRASGRFTTSTNRTNRIVTDSNKSSNFSETVPDTIEVESKMKICKCNDNECRKTVPLTDSLLSKPKRIIRSNKKNRQSSTSSDLSSICAKSNLSISDENSCFSNTIYKTSKTVKKFPLHHSSPIAGKMDSNDHKLQRRFRPSDPTDEIISAENQPSAAFSNKKRSLLQQTRDTVLRGKITRDYHNLLKNLDLLCKEDKAMTANEQVHDSSENTEEQSRRQKQIDQVFQTALRSSRHCNSEHIAPAWLDEKQIEGSYSNSNADSTRKRKISKLLLRIDKLKDRLTQEYKNDLPDDSSATIRFLFDYPNSANQQKIKNAVTESISSEIRVVNMSICDEVAEPVPRVIDKNKKDSSIQTPAKILLKQSGDVSSGVSTRDQQVQIDLDSTKIKDETAIKPPTPVFKIIAPNDDSDDNSSTCSNSPTMTNLVVDFNETEITVLPNSSEIGIKISNVKSDSSSIKSKRYSTHETPVKISFDQKRGNASINVSNLLIDANQRNVTILPRRRKISSNISHSLYGSKDASPSEKRSKLSPSMHQSSPKKSLDSREAKELRTKETRVEERSHGTQFTQVPTDSSLESPWLNCAAKNASANTANRFYKLVKALRSKQNIGELQDVSDTSTRYASPPPGIAGSMINTVGKSAPILELLSSPIIDAINHQSQLSPVSSPETPSPRTMKLPSNMRKSDKVNQSLRSASLNRRQTKADSSNLFKSNRTPAKDRSPLRSESSRHACTYKVFHKSESTRSFTLKNDPEILKNFEDLKNDCSQRIASLANSILKLRNEQEIELYAATTEAATGTALSASDQHQVTVDMLSKEILEQSKYVKKSVAADTLKDPADYILKSIGVNVKDGEEQSEQAASKGEQNQSLDLNAGDSDFVPLLAGIPKAAPRILTSGRNRYPFALKPGPYGREIISSASDLATTVEFDNSDSVNKSQVGNKASSNKCRKKLSTREVAKSIGSTLSMTSNNESTERTSSITAAPLPVNRSPRRVLRLSSRSISKNKDKLPRVSAEKSLRYPKNKKELKNEMKRSDSSDSLYSLPDARIDQGQRDYSNAFNVREIAEMHSLPDANIERMSVSDLHEESERGRRKQKRDKCRVTLSDCPSFSGTADSSESTSTVTSDLNLFEYPASPEGMKLACKKRSLGWAIRTLKKTREASALGSSSSSDATPVSPTKRPASAVKKKRERTANDLPLISDVSTISLKHANTNTRESVLVTGRTSTPNKKFLRSFDSDDIDSTLGSFSPGLNVVWSNNRNADINDPNVSFLDNRLDY